MFYAVDIEGLVRRGTNGALASDPTVPYRPSRLTLLRRRARVWLMLGSSEDERRSCPVSSSCVADQRAG